MFNKRRLATVLCLLLSVSAFAKRIITVISPDNTIKFSLSADKDGLFYKVTYKGVLMVDLSRLNISFKEGGTFNNQVTIGPAVPERVTEDYSLIIGKTSKVHSESNRILVPVTEQTGAKRTLDIEVRVFNDCAAFRYVIPQQNGWPAQVNVTD